METPSFTIPASVRDPYYQEEFRKIHESNETYKGKWNWWAFFFTGFWALFKGCWVLFLLIFLTGSVISFKFPISDNVYLGFGLGSLIWALIMGWRGTWFYYVLKIKGKQPPL